MKELNIRVWPEGYAYFPSLSRIERKPNSDHILYIDFSGCNELSSTGMTVLLLQLLSFVKQSEKKRNYYADPINKNELVSSARKLALFKHLNLFLGQSGLYPHELLDYSDIGKIEHLSYGGRKVVSHPIYSLNLDSYSESSRREAGLSFRKMLMEILAPYVKEYKLHHTQLIAILTEIFKNTADHSRCEGYFGLDIVDIPEKREKSFRFVLGDLGKGIKKNIQEFIVDNDTKFTRTSKLGLPDVYHYALTRGFTTKPGSVDNRGIGMSIIREGSKSIGGDLSIFDAFSRGVLTSINKISHADIRKSFYSFNKDHSKPFFYYGVINAVKKH